MPKKDVPPGLKKKEPDMGIGENIGESTGENTGSAGRIIQTGGIPAPTYAAWFKDDLELHAVDVNYTEWGGRVPSRHRRNRS